MKFAYAMIFTAVVFVTVAWDAGVAMKKPVRMYRYVSKDGKYKTEWKPVPTWDDPDAVWLKPTPEQLKKLGKNYSGQVRHEDAMKKPSIMISIALIVASIYLFLVVWDVVLEMQP